MAEYKKWLDDFAHWLKDIKEHELEDLINTFIESQGKLKELGEEKVKN